MYSVIASNLNENSVVINDKVLLQICEQEKSSTKYGNIFLPISHMENCQLLKAKVISKGHKTSNTFNIGDYVLYDRYAAYFHPPQTPNTFILVDEFNIIIRVTKNGKLRVYGNNALVRIELNKRDEKYGNIIMSDVSKEHKDIFIVEQMGNKTPLDISLGDRVYGTVRNSTFITYEGVKYIILPYDNVICRFENASENI